MEPTNFLYAIPSAHSSNPLYAGHRSSLPSAEPDTSSSSYSNANATIQFFTNNGNAANNSRVVFIPGSELDDAEGLEEYPDQDESAARARAAGQGAAGGITAQRKASTSKKRAREAHDSGVYLEEDYEDVGWDQQDDEESEDEDGEDYGLPTPYDWELEEKKFHLQKYWEMRGFSAEAAERKVHKSYGWGVKVEDEFEDDDHDEMAGRLPEERQMLEVEMGGLEDSVPGLLEQYRLVDRLGEGTFSSVYKAIDLKNSSFDNSLWLTDPSPSPDATSATIANNDKKKKKKPKVYVALKRIYVTSSPTRIENEISILEDLRGCSNISQIITAFRFEDQILVVMPFHCNDDFRNYYRHLTPVLLRSYFRELFLALRATHARGIIHRDVKPANFLFDEADGSGILVDFGLAQRYNPPTTHHPRCQHSPASFENPHGTRIRTSSTKTVEQAIYDARKKSKLSADKVGFPNDDKRPSVKANRAGTRGFRAPEVLLKCPDQTVAIDIWSAGIILLSILTRKFPIFNSNDDTEALMEISAIFGKAKMDKCAAVHNRTLTTNLPSLDHPGKSLEALILKCNPELYTPIPQPSPSFPSSPTSSSPFRPTSSTSSPQNPHPHPPSSPTSHAAEHTQAIEEALDFLKRCLTLDPCKRVTAGEALRHPFLRMGDEEDDEEGGGEMERMGPRRPGESVCGRLHEYDEGKGMHRVKVMGQVHEVGFGEGIAFGDEPCPIHKVHGY